METGEQIQFDFMGFNKWEDFYSIIDIIQRKIQPDILRYHGLVDINGYFEKDGLSVSIEFTEQVGNSLVYMIDENKESFNMVSRWAKQIFDEMISDRRKRNELR